MNINDFRNGIKVYFRTKLPEIVIFFKFFDFEYGCNFTFSFLGFLLSSGEGVDSPFSTFCSLSPFVTGAASFSFSSSCSLPSFSVVTSFSFSGVPLSSCFSLSYVEYNIMIYPNILQKIYFFIAAVHTGTKIFYY